MIRGHSSAALNRFLVGLGVLLVVAGLAWPWLSRLPLGQLPGDLHFRRDGVEFHFPIVTCLLVSVIVSLLLWLWRR